MQHFVPTPKSEEILDVTARRHTIMETWADLRDSFCDSSPCICKHHPRYNELVANGLEPLTKILNDLDKKTMIVKAKCAAIN